METSQKNDINLEDCIAGNRAISRDNKVVQAYLIDLYPHPNLQILEMALCGTLDIPEKIIRIYPDSENKNIGSVIIKETGEHKLPLLFKKTRVKNAVLSFYQKRDFKIENIVENGKHLRMLKFDAIKNDERYKICVNHDTDSYSFRKLDQFAIYVD